MTVPGSESKKDAGHGRHDWRYQYIRETCPKAGGLPGRAVPSLPALRTCITRSHFTEISHHPALQSRLVRRQATGLFFLSRSRHGDCQSCDKADDLKKHKEETLRQRSRAVLLTLAKPICSGSPMRCFGRRRKRATSRA
jgi:hypothetical protein